MQVNQAQHHYPAHTLANLHINKTKQLQANLSGKKHSTFTNKGKINKEVKNRYAKVNKRGKKILKHENKNSRVTKLLKKRKRLKLN